MQPPRSAPVIVRGVCPVDAAVLGDLIGQHAAFEQAPPPPPGIGARVATLAQRGRLWCWIARAANSTVGYATVTEDVATFTGEAFGHLDCLFVSERWRGVGAGRALMVAAAGWSAGRAHAQMQWQTPHWNVDARHFYSNLGATSRAKYRYFLPPGALARERQIDTQQGER